MNNQSLFSRISEQASGLGHPCSSEEIAHLAEIKDMSPSINGEVLYLIRQALAQHEAKHGTLK